MDQLGEDICISNGVVGERASSSREQEPAPSYFKFIFPCLTSSHRAEG